MITLTRIEIRVLRLPLLAPFETSFGRESTREVIIITAYAGDGVIGWGECSTFARPTYNEEDTVTARHVLASYIIPDLLDNPVASPQDYAARYAWIRGHRMAKAALEEALWDIAAQRAGQPLWKYLGGTRQQIPAGVSVGIAPTDAALLQEVSGYVEAGYHRVKLKIKPGRDAAPVAAVRAAFPNLPLQVDANSAYTLSDASIAALKRLDDYNLLLIEQPLGEDDLIDHATLQPQLRTPICLDESLRSREDVRKMMQLGSGRIVNLKRGRVGGLTEVLAIHEFCVANSIPLWCGGMLETGIGRAINLAVASLPGMTMVGDVSASNRFYAEDVIAAPFQLVSSGPQRGTISVPNSPGIGVRVNQKVLDSYAISYNTYRPSLVIRVGGG